MGRMMFLPHPTILGQNMDDKESYVRNIVWTASLYNGNSSNHSSSTHHRSMEQGLTRGLARLFPILYKEEDRRKVVPMHPQMS